VPPMPVPSAAFCCVQRQTGSFVKRFHILRTVLLGVRTLHPQFGKGSLRLDPGAPRSDQVAGYQATSSRGNPGVIRSLLKYKALRNLNANAHLPRTMEFRTDLKAAGSDMYLVLLQQRPEF